MSFFCPDCKVRLYVADIDASSATVAYCENCDRRFRIHRRPKPPDLPPAPPSFSHRAACALLLAAVLVLWAWKRLQT